MSMAGHLQSSCRVCHIDDSCADVAGDGGGPQPGDGVGLPGAGQLAGAPVGR